MTFYVETCLQLSEDIYSGACAAWKICHTSEHSNVTCVQASGTLHLCGSVVFSKCCFCIYSL